MKPRKHTHKLAGSVREIVRRMQPAGHNPIAVYREVLAIHGKGSISANTVREIFVEFNAEQAKKPDNGYGPGKNSKRPVDYEYTSTEQEDIDTILSGPKPGLMAQESMEIESDLRSDFAVHNVVNAGDVSFTIPGQILALANSGANIRIEFTDYAFSIERKDRS